MLIYQRVREKIWHVYWMPWIYQWKSRMVWFFSHVFFPSKDVWNIMVVVWRILGQVTGRVKVNLPWVNVHFECDACDAEPEGTVCSWTRTKMVCQTKRFTQDPMRLVKLSEDCGSSILGCPKMEGAKFSSKLLVNFQLGNQWWKGVGLF